MNTQERIQYRHKILDYLVIEKPEGASKEEISALGDVEKSLGDLVYMGLVRKKGGKFVVPEAVAKRWVRIRGRDD
jgi:hypothetical protein